MNILIAKFLHKFVIFLLGYIPSWGITGSKSSHICQRLLKGVAKLSFRKVTLVDSCVCEFKDKPKSQEHTI